MGKVIFWIVFGIVMFLISSVIFVGTAIYSVILVRTSKKKWVRGKSMPEDAMYSKLFDEGQVWRETHLDAKKDVQIKSGHLNLYGEYFDFGSKKAVIILAGRMETCLYGDYFAEPYEKAGYNVLTIDARAHGLSEGHFNSLGHHEAKDTCLWARFLHETYGIEEIVIHGVCIGSSVAAQALVRDDCPDYVTKMVGEGMYTRFYDTYMTHLISLGHKPFPVGLIPMLELMICTGANPFREGPKDALPRLKKPILMLHSREDIYSLPEKAEQLYESISGAKKRIVWFDHGTHSKIRIESEENRVKYDAEVTKFLANY